MDITRKEKVNRPLWTFGFPFFTSLIAVSFLSYKVAGIISFVLACLFLITLFIKKIRLNRRVIIALVAVITAFSIYSVKEFIVVEPLEIWDGKTVNLTLETLDFPKNSDTANSVLVKVKDSESGISKGRKMTLWFTGTEIYPQPYDILSGEFEISIPNDSREGNIRGYSKSKGVYLNAKTTQYGDVGIEHETPTGRKPLMFYVLKLKKQIIGNITGQPNISDVSGLIAGISFGDTSGIEMDTERAFKEIGATHLLAVSGFQTALIGQGLFLFFKKLKRSKRTSALLSGVGILLFMALTGFSQSVVRAGIMSIVYMLGIMIDKDSDPLNSLGLSVIFICLLNPYAVNDIGLLLSFAATFGLIVIQPFFQRKILDKMKEKGSHNRLIYGVINIVTTSISATIPIIPILVLTFRTLPIISPIASVFMMLPANIVVVLTLIGSVISFIPVIGQVSSFLFLISAYISRYLDFVAKAFAKIPFASVYIKEDYMVFLIIGIFIFILISYKLLKKEGVKKAAFLSVIVLMSGIFINHIYMRGITTITSLSSGNSTALILEKQGKTGVVISGKRTVINRVSHELENKLVKTLDFVIIHGNDEAIQNINLLAENFEIDNIITTSDSKYQSTIEKLNKTGTILYIDKTDGDNKIKFWDDCYITVSKNDFMLLGIDKTNILITPENSGVEDFDLVNSAHLAVFTVSPPAGYKDLKIGKAILNCYRDKMKFVPKAFSDVEYDVYYTYSKKVVVKTRGTGDLKILGDKGEINGDY